MPLSELKIVSPRDGSNYSIIIYNNKITINALNRYGNIIVSFTRMIYNKKILWNSDDLLLQSWNKFSDIGPIADKIIANIAFI